MSYYDDRAAADAFYAQRDANEAYSHAEGAEREMFRQMDRVNELEREVERLAMELHKLQAHPDYTYSHLGRIDKDYWDQWEPVPYVRDPNIVMHPKNQQQKDAE